jgi:hypothetical protein
LLESTETDIATKICFCGVWHKPLGTCVSCKSLVLMVTVNWKMLMIAVKSNNRFYGFSYKPKMKKNKREIKTSLGRP